MDFRDARSAHPFDFSAESSQSSHGVSIGRSVFRFVALQALATEDAGPVASNFKSTVVELR